MLYENFKAQGTIEYLVILAVIVVISLIVVGLVVGVTSSPSQQISSSSSKAGEVAVGGISIVESVIDPSGDSLVFLANNSSESITLKKISVGGVDNNYNDALVGLDSKGFSLSGLSSACPCASGQKSVKCEFRIEYLSATGITKTELRTINVTCVNDSKPTDEDKIIDPIIDSMPVIADCFDEGKTPVPICTLNDLNKIRDDLTESYVLLNDIDASETISWNNGLGFEPIGFSYNAPFGGNFDGNNYVISNLYINRPNSNYVGLFGFINQGTIQNIRVVDANVRGSSQVGALIGMSCLWEDLFEDCHVYNSYSSGTVYGSSYNAGGLIGGNTGSITNSYSLANVTGNSNVGGLIGYGFGPVYNSYSKGLVFGSYDYGGLVGYYNSDGGPGYGIFNSFWDTQTSNQSSSAGGSGKTTVEMQTPSTFTNAGWDTGIWNLVDGQYPSFYE